MKITIYKKTLFNFFFITLIFLLSIVIFNYFIDAANQFFHSNKLEAKIANAFINHQKILLSANYNERAVQKLVLKKINQRPNTLILGSSRVMHFNKNFFNHSNFYNGWISSATLEDVLVTYYRFQKRGWQPNTIVLGLDHWLLDKNNHSQQWKITSLSEYDKARKLILGQNMPKLLKYYQHVNGFCEKYSQLLSFIYFKSSILRLMAKSTIPDGVIINPDNEAICPACHIRQDDGTAFYSKLVETTSGKQADAAAVDLVNQYQHDFGDYTNLDPDYMNVFEHFIKYLSTQHINVILYLPPIEPLAFSLFKNDNKFNIIFSAENYFISIAKKYHLEIIGSYNPNNLGLENNDFIDGLHLKKKSIEKIFNSKIA